MARVDVDVHFSRVESLVKDAERLVPEGTRGSTDFRADLAGLLVVAMAVSYETCVKTVLTDYAASRHVDFGIFTENNFSKLNSKVSVDDLAKYAKLFGGSAHANFMPTLKRKKDALFRRTGINIETSYGQILSWRHAYAHAGQRSTTITEAIKTHRYGKRVLYIFASAFI